MISVIIPIYNAEATLAACVKSVLDQDCRDFELLLIDDGSTDRSGTICEELAAQDARIHVIHQANAGVSAARNAGIDASAGEYLCFVDADDAVESTCLSYLLFLLRQDDRCRISQANHWIRRNHGSRLNEPIQNGFAILSQQEAAHAVLLHDRLDVSCWGKLYHRSVFENSRFPEGRIYEDTWLFGELLQKTDTYVYGYQPQYHYILREGSLTRRAFSDENLHYIEAAEKLARDTEQIDPACHTDGVRRINHARFSVLRYMEHCEDAYKATRRQLRAEILRDAPQYIREPQTPRRDRAALLLLRMGLKPFFLGWRLYDSIRGGGA